ncbi:MAG: hypothetical protein VX589_12895 [Myxococcota bacterium]|nr:hypothetical protein [Myxococcota bacterium]
MKTQRRDLLIIGVFWMAGCVAGGPNSGDGQRTPRGGTTAVSAGQNGTPDEGGADRAGGAASPAAGGATAVSAGQNGTPDEGGADRAGSAASPANGGAVSAGGGASPAAGGADSAGRASERTDAESATAGQASLIAGTASENRDAGGDADADADADEPEGGQAGGHRATEPMDDGRDPGPIGEAVGNRCASPSDCPPGELGRPLCLTESYASGYCSAICAVDENCPNGGICVGRTCMAACDDNADCRPNYRCDTTFGDGVPVCVPSTPALGVSGASCDTPTDCQGSIYGRICTPASQTHTYCTGYCEIDGDCPSDSLCAINRNSNGICVKRCEFDLECPAGFACYDLTAKLARQSGVEENTSRTACYPVADGRQAIGESCVGLGDCAGGENGLCIYRGDAPVCSAFCDAENACPDGGQCSFVNPDNGAGYCMKACQERADCADGLICDDLNNRGLPICQLGGSGDKPSSAPCTSVTECSGGALSLCITPLDNGPPLCTRRCSFKAPCPDGEHCASENDLEEGRCLRDCEPGQAEDCDAGQACFDQDNDGRAECMPARFGTFDVAMGNACQTSDQCERGLSCNGGIYQNVIGICSRECQQDEDCTPSTRCANISQVTNLGVCVSGCETPDDCDGGLACADVYDNDGAKECVATSLGTARVGDPCEHQGWCPGGALARCVRNGIWTNRGYCAINGCTAEFGCPTGSHCSYIDAETNRGICLADCGGEMQCEHDLTCRDIDGDNTMECVPPTDGTSPIGGGCMSQRDCQSSLCLDAGYPRGMCSAPCVGNVDCPAGTHCEIYADGAGLCLPDCENDGDCRADYVCDNLYSATATTCVGLGVGDSEVGEPCRSSSDCALGLRMACIVPSNGWTNGYCLKYRCDPTGGCAAGTHCGFYNRYDDNGGYCLQSCADDDDCPRHAYSCYDFDGDGRRECAPTRPQATGVETCAELDVCISACGRFDAGCRETCYARSTVEAVVRWDRMVACQRSAACETNDAFCQVERCEDERAACYGLSAVPNSEGTCLELESCLRRCDTDEPRCRPECIAAASPTAYQAYETVMACRAVRSVENCRIEVDNCTSN